MSFVVCFPCAIPEWNIAWGDDLGWYFILSLGPLHLEVNNQRSHA